MLSRLAVLVLAFIPSSVASANPPVAVYVFPPGGQRGQTVDVRVGGLFLHEQCPWEVIGSGVKASPMLKRIPTLWFEGPILPLPDSQRQEDYPRDMLGTLTLAKDAPLGSAFLRMRTSQGVTAGLPFVVGDLPEVVEKEIDGDPIPVEVKLPITINGRIFPREDIDLWKFEAKKGEKIHLEVFASRIGSPADLRLEILDEAGRRLAESDSSRGTDSAMTFEVPNAGSYVVRVQDSQFLGSQAHVYRLTVTRDPVVTSVFPLGAKRGQKTTLHLAGSHLPSKTLEIAVPADAPSQWLASVPGLRYPLTGVPLEIDDLPEVSEPSKASPIPLPAILNGRIAKAGQADDWTFKASKGETIEFDLKATRLGTRLIGVLSVLDSTGKVLGKAEANGTTDCQLRVTAPVEGTYTLRVQDRYPRRGGAEFCYRIKAGASAEPNFSLALGSDSLTVLRKGNGKLKLQIDRVGTFKEAIELRFPGLPADVSVQPTKINPGQTTLDLTFTAKETAKVEHVAVAVVGVAKVAGKEIERTATHRPSNWQAPTMDKIALAIAMPTPFVIKGEYDMGFAARGAVHQRKYKIERNGYDGPLEILLADRQARHLQGVTGSTITVPAGTNEFTYAVQLPPWMETGRTCRVCVMGVATVKDEAGRDHRVSFSSVNQNEQLVAVVGPGQLAMELDQSSGTLIAGQPLAIGVKVKRGRGFDGPVRLELLTPDHLRMVTVEPMTIAKDREAGMMKIRVAGPMPGILNMPLTVRAVLDHATGPIIAEAKLDLQPGR